MPSPRSPAASRSSRSVRAAWAIRLLQSAHDDDAPGGAPRPVLGRRRQRDRRRSSRNRLLGLALEAGGDYADLYFEYRVGADYALEEEQIRTLGRGITLGLGVRVTKGDATGYAYYRGSRVGEDGRTPRRPRGRSRSAAATRRSPIAVADQVPIAELLRGADAVARACPRTTSSRCCAPADKAARAFDPRIVKVEASFAEELKRGAAVHVGRPHGRATSSR